VLRRRRVDGFACWLGRRPATRAIGRPPGRAAGRRSWSARRGERVAVAAERPWARRDAGRRPRKGWPSGGVDEPGPAGRRGGNPRPAVKAAYLGPNARAGRVVVGPPRSHSIVGSCRRAEAPGYLPRRRREPSTCPAFHLRPRIGPAGAVAGPPAGGRSSGFRARRRGATIGTLRLEPVSAGFRVSTGGAPLPAAASGAPARRGGRRAPDATAPVRAPAGVAAQAAGTERAFCGDREWTRGDVVGVRPGSRARRALPSFASPPPGGASTAWTVVRRASGRTFVVTGAGGSFTRRCAGGGARGDANSGRLLPPRGSHGCGGRAGPRPPRSRLRRTASRGVARGRATPTMGSETGVHRGRVVLGATTMHGGAGIGGSDRLLRRPSRSPAGATRCCSPGLAGRPGRFARASGHPARRQSSALVTLVEPSRACPRPEREAPGRPRSTRRLAVAVTGQNPDDVPGRVRPRPTSAPQRRPAMLRGSQSGDGRAVVSALAGAGRRATGSGVAGPFLKARPTADAVARPFVTRSRAVPTSLAWQERS